MAETPAKYWLLLSLIVWRIYDASAAHHSSLTGVLHSGGSSVKLCYYNSTAADRIGEGQFKLSNIDPFICTHIVYASVDVVNGIRLNHNVHPDFHFGMKKLKRENGHLKLMFSIVLKWSELSITLTDPAWRRLFIKNLFDFIDVYAMDGIDITWPHLGTNSLNQSIRQSVVLVDFMQALREQIGRHRIISLTVPCDTPSIHDAYDFPRLNRYVNYYNLLTYNLNRNSFNETSFQMPLRNTHPDSKEIYTVEQIVAYLISRDAERTKILLGIGVHAHTFVLANQTDTDLYAAASGPGSAGPLTNTTGSLSYTEVCLTLAEGGWTIVYNEEMAGVYAYRRDRWMTYETPRTMKGKQWFAASMNLGGVMIKSIDGDDMSYACGPQTNVLLEVLWVDN